MDSNLWTATFWAAIATVAAAFISRQIKISEFRHTWINDLRHDVADYITASNKWYFMYEQWNDLSSKTTPEAELERKTLLPKQQKQWHETLTILYRIKLRINPNATNPNKEEDNDFLVSLEELINPGKICPENRNAPRHETEEKAMMLARQLLKREWETTKKGMFAKIPSAINRIFSQLLQYAMVIKGWLTSRISCCTHKNP